MSTLPLFDAEHLSATEAKAAEFVPTPGWVPRVLVEQMAAAGHPPLPFNGPRVESGAGMGAIVDAIDALAGSGHWTLCELRADAVSHLQLMRPMRDIIRLGDYLVRGSGVTGAGLWITNPAWSLAGAYLRKNIEEAAGVGTVALHVPWAFAATDALDGLAVDLYPIEGRPYSFARETCWIVTGPGRGGRFLRLRKPR